MCRVKKDTTITRVRFRCATTKSSDNESVCEMKCSGFVIVLRIGTNWDRGAC